MHAQVFLSAGIACSSGILQAASCCFFFALSDFELVAKAEFNYISCLSDQWNCQYPPGAHSSGILGSISRCVKSSRKYAVNEGPALLRAKDAKSLAEMEGAVEILMHGRSL